MAEALPLPKAPLGMFNARADERGRVKFPVNFQEYFKNLPEKSLFVTTLDRETARVYPIAVWRDNEAFFAEHRDDDAENAYFRAMRFGEESEMDNQGRVGLSTDLRKELNLIDQPVKIWARDGVVNIISEAIFEKRQSDSDTLDKPSLGRLRVAGLK